MRREPLPRPGLRSTRALPSAVCAPAHQAIIRRILRGWSASMRACAWRMCRSGDVAYGSLIGIGGSLAAPPLPHHRTYGSVYGGSRRTLTRFDQMIRLVLAGRSDSCTTESDSMSSRNACRASPVGADEKSSLNWMFSRLSLSRFMSYLPLLSFGPSVTVPGSAYLLTPPFGMECLTSLADDIT